MTQDEVLQLALAHRDRIWGFISALCRDRTRTEDVFQQTFLVLCRKWSDFEPGSNFLAWALTIARYEFLASVDPKRHRDLAVESEVLEAIILTAGEPEEPATDRRNALLACMERLGARARQAFHLRYGDGMANADLARRLRTTEEALYALLSRTRRTLRACIERRLAGEA